MMFVLANMLRGTTATVPNSGRSEISVRLIPGGEHNEVRITSELDTGIPASDGDERANRCALWAFGGELVISRDGDQGINIASIRLPKA
jgi:two-component system probable response regulator PhcQ